MNINQVINWTKYKPVIIGGIDPQLKLDMCFYLILAHTAIFYPNRFDEITLINTTNIQYVTIATTGNSTSFGTSGGGGQCTSASNGTRSVSNSASNGNYEYITIATTGNTTSFGNTYHSSPQNYDKAANAGGNRGIWYGLYIASSASYLGNIE